MKTSRSNRLKKPWRKLLAGLLLLALMIGYLPPLAAEAAQPRAGWYETNSGSPLWSKNYSNKTAKDSKKLATIPKDTPLYISAVSTNDKGNTFGKVNYQGATGWVFFGNLNEHQHVVDPAKTVDGSSRYCLSETEHRVHIIHYLFCRCGTQMGHEVLANEVQPHSLNGDTCTVCSYQRHTCQVAEYFQCTPLYQLLGDGSLQHIRIDKMVSKCQCGKVLDTEYQVLETLEDCTFDDDGVCTKCLAIEDHQHSYSTSVRFEITPVIGPDGISQNYLKITEEVCACGDVAYYDIMAVTEANDAAVKGPMLEEYYQSDMNQHSIVRVYEKECGFCGHDYDEVLPHSDCICRSFGLTYGDMYYYEVLPAEDHSYVKQGDSHMCEVCGFDTLIFEQNKEMYLDILQTACDVAGFIPGVGNVFDLSSALIAMSRGHWGEAAIGVLCALPAVGIAAGIFKSADIAVTTAKIITKIDNVYDTLAGSKLLAKINKLPVNQGFESFEKLKKLIGKAGDGYEWHRIVSQTMIERCGFPAEWVHNTSNIIALPADVHKKITKHYNSAGYGYSHMYEYLQNLSFEEQYEYAINLLKKYGVIFE